MISSQVAGSLWDCCSFGWDAKAGFWPADIGHDSLASLVQDAVIDMHSSPGVLSVLPLVHCSRPVKSRAAQQKRPWGTGSHDWYPAHGILRYWVGPASWEPTCTFAEICNPAIAAETKGCD